MTRRLKALGWLATWTMAAAVVAMFVDRVESELARAPVPGARRTFTLS